MDNYLELFNKVKTLTLEEKASLVTGYNTWFTFPILNKDIPSLVVSDGPNGIRKEIKEEDVANGFSNTVRSTCFPSLSTLACSFNEETTYNVGEALAKEARLFGVDFVLGPGLNIKRNPLCGRNFEYFSEDPFLTGKLAASFSRGIRDKDVGLTLKHFALNNTENHRFNGNSNVDERAMREIYLSQFKMAIDEGRANGIMTSYNKVNDEHASENPHLLVDILRNEWNFEGLVMSDWGGIKDRVKSVCTQNDLEMPGNTPLNKKRIIDAVNNKKISEDLLDLCCIHILNAIKETKKENTYNESILDEHIKVAVDAAIDSAVLLKNNGVLPLKNDKKYLVIGDLFKKLRFQGAGSSQINPYKIITNEEAFNNHNIKYEFAQGYYDFDSEGTKQGELNIELINKIKDYDTIIYFGGLTSLSESEGFDRETLELPYNQRNVIELLSKIKEDDNKEIIFISYGGAPYIIPHENIFSAILHMALPGEGGGEALAQLLLNVSPSGKLSETWLRDYKDLPFNEEYGKTNEEYYKESIYVGYRYFSTIPKKILYPFGYGLTYTTFIYKELNIKEKEDSLIVSFKIKNTGGYKAKAVPELYVGKEDSRFFRPKYELKGFKKVELEPGEEKETSIEVKKDYLKVYFTDESRFVLEDGRYEFYLAESLKENILTFSYKLEGEKVEPHYDEDIRNIYFNPAKLTKLTNEQFARFLGRKLNEPIKVKKPYNMETRLSDMNSFIANRVKKAIVKSATKSIVEASKKKPKEDRINDEKSINFISKSILSNTFRSLCFSSSGMLKEYTANGLLELCNGHIFKALKYFMKKE